MKYRELKFFKNLFVRYKSRCLCCSLQNSSPISGMSQSHVVEACKNCYLIGWLHENFCFSSFDFAKASAEVMLCFVIFNIRKLFLSEILKHYRHPSKLFSNFLKKKAYLATFHS